MPELCEQPANSPSHAEPRGPRELEPESEPVSEGHGATGNVTDLALEEAGGEDKLGREGGLGIEQLNSEVDRLPQMVRRQN